VNIFVRDQGPALQAVNKTIANIKVINGNKYLLMVNRSFLQKVSMRMKGLSPIGLFKNSMNP
jgi:hypothetical protein